jgi:uncharacterized protein (DUF1697 family)
MPSHVALLRGVNVGGVRISMPDLRAAVESLGHTDVATYVNSGNVVFTVSGRPSTSALAADLVRAIQEHAGIEPVVIVLTSDQWDDVVAKNPYSDETDGTKLHAVVAQDPYGAAQRAAAEQVRDAVREAGSDDDLAVVGRVVYLRLPDGMGRSKLAEKLGRSRTAGQREATARNWRTVLALQAKLHG